MRRVVLWSLLAAAILYFAGIGVLYTERDHLDAALETNASLSCCDGPSLKRDQGRAEQAAESKPPDSDLIRNVL